MHAPTAAPHPTPDADGGAGPPCWRVSSCSRRRGRWAGRDGPMFTSTRRTLYSTGEALNDARSGDLGACRSLGVSRATIDGGGGRTPSLRRSAVAPDPRTRALLQRRGSLLCLFVGGRTEERGGAEGGAASDRGQALTSTGPHASTAAPPSPAPANTHRPHVLLFPPPSAPHPRPPGAAAVAPAEPSALPVWGCTGAAGAPTIELNPTFEPSERDRDRRRPDVVVSRRGGGAPGALSSRRTGGTAASSPSRPFSPLPPPPIGRMGHGQQMMSQPPPTEAREGAEGEGEAGEAGPADMGMIKVPSPARTAKLEASGGGARTPTQPAVG